MKTETGRRGHPALTRGELRAELVPIPRERVRRRRSEIQSPPGREGPASAAGDEVYVFPTSFDQERLFFVELLKPGSTYNVPMPVPFPGLVDVSALARTVRELGRRHESLRTTLGYLDRRPVQVVSCESQVEMEVMDLRRMPEAERMAEAARITREHALEPFDLVRRPLWRALLLRLADDNHVLLLNLHHATTDLWSTGLLLSELSTLYLAFAQGQPSPLPELPLQYGDYATWQRRFLDEQGIRELMAYWKGQLAGAPQVLKLPADRPRPQVPTVRGDDWMFPLGQELSQKLLALCRQQRATVFHGLVAGVALLLGHYGDVEDLLIGSPMSNRTRPGLEGLIGLFVNTVVLRVRPAAHLTFNELVRQVRATTLDAFDHQDLPLGMLIDEVLEDRNASHTPLFQVMIAHQTDAMSTRPFHMQLPEGIGEGTRVAGTTGTAKYDLVLSVLESDSGLLGTWEYSLDLFEEPTIQRLGRRYRQLMEAAVEDPHRRLAELRRRIEELDRADFAAVAAPASVTPAPPPPARQEPPAATWPSNRGNGHRTELQMRLDSLTDAEVDGLLDELVAQSDEEAVRAGLEALFAGAGAKPGKPAANGGKSAAEAERLLSQLDQLSDAEVDDLLGGLLSQEEHVA